MRNPDPRTYHSLFPDLDPPVLKNEPLRLSPFHVDADPDPAFHYDADPDPVSQKDALSGR